ncbi:antibiotic biosynthesis monooxygenase [Nocardia yamanashiensis]|uniref:putative quinol monooxygenase n=1 Tax=Nocardia yamanashiensis TaxID=209247 RepID=UPI001E649E96|nr:antibiotic biosynthesis monooxygenase family protein [Nocardia yamanashiensis]UGT44287.1 antibiotic biosynthesis monooxygenase [Nocardia yamanashiensis]
MATISEYRGGICWEEWWFMPIQHIVTIQVAPGRAGEFAEAFEALKAVVEREDGCEQYDLLQSMSSPDTLVILERWTGQDLLDKHMRAEGAEHQSLIDALIALWAPGTTPSVLRFGS